MSASIERLPFELVCRGKGAWWARWTEEEVGVEVGGTEEAPSDALVATLVDVIGRWPEVKQAIAAFLRALVSEHHVPLDPPTIGGFAARSCGFDGELYFQSISVNDGDAPRRCCVTFYTGLPDGYATYEIVLEGGAPIAVSAFAS